MIDRNVIFTDLTPLQQAEKYLEENKDVIYSRKEIVGMVKGLSDELRALKLREHDKLVFTNTTVGADL